DLVERSPRGERVGQRSMQGASIASGVGAIGEAKTRLRVEWVLGHRARHLLGGGARIPRPLEDVGDAGRDVLAIGVALLDPSELRDGGLPVLSCEGALEPDFGLGIEPLDARRDLVRLRAAPVLVEALEVRAERARVVRESLYQIGERTQPFGAPTEP